MADPLIQHLNLVFGFLEIKEVVGLMTSSKQETNNLPTVSLDTLNRRPSFHLIALAALICCGTIEGIQSPLIGIFIYASMTIECIRHSFSNILARLWDLCTASSLPWIHNYYISFAVSFSMQMDICSRIGFPANDINSLHGICLDTLGPAYGIVGDFSVDELAYGVTKFLNIQDDGGVLGSIPPHKKGVFQMKDGCGEAHQSEIITEDHEKLFSKCATFPCSSKTLPSAAASVEGALKGKMKDDADDITSDALTHDDNAKSIINPPCSSAPSLPKPLKPVSAMKGSREKRGVGPSPKLSVKWGPDVYDPVPTSMLQMLSNSRGPHKHNGKKKSKKKGSRESKGKEKKQSRKRGGGSCLNYYYCEQKEEVGMDFHLDLFCGSSFANGYGSSLHLPEAT